MLKRNEFIKLMASLPAGLVISPMKIFEGLTELSDEQPMPVLFIGHGSPMNAIEENEFTKGFREMGKGIPRPKAILCISAHWETAGTYVTAMERPRTIHDFGGFPQALFDVQYPASGFPEIVTEAQNMVQSRSIQADYSWGLDHGAWSVIKHLYPAADIPVVELSLDYRLDMKSHYSLGTELASLRKKGILIIGSGNIVHNLSMVAWDKLNEHYGYEWALEAQSKINTLVMAGHHDELINIRSSGKAFEHAIPSAEHYLPLLYTLALRQANEPVTKYNDQAVAGSLTMTSYKFG